MHGQLLLRALSVHLKPINENADTWDKANHAEQPGESRKYVKKKKLIELASELAKNG